MLNRLPINTIHGKSNTPTYNSWSGMKHRCKNPYATSYIYYGARGIKFCKRWKIFKNFYKDMGERPDGLTLERINNNKGYSKSNCKWATRKEQANNKRTAAEVKNQKIVNKPKRRRYKKPPRKLYPLEKRYMKLMSKKDVNQKELSEKLKCSTTSIKLIICGITKTGDIKKRLDKFLTKEEL